jgi:hypothetical protein
MKQLQHRTRRNKVRQKILLKESFGNDMKIYV